MQATPFPGGLECPRYSAFVGASQRNEYPDLPQHIFKLGWLARWPCHQAVQPFKHTQPQLLAAGDSKYHMIQLAGTAHWSSS